MIRVYRFIIFLLIIFSPIILIIRLLKKKEHPQRFKEKFCFFSKKRSKGKIIWFHGASVGELQSVIPLIEILEKDKKINQILITSNTLSSSKIIKNFKFKKVVHQFFPVDLNFFSKKFLNFWKPSMSIFIDSEIWPNMILNLEKKKIPIILLNGRITKKTFKRWLFFSNFATNLFSKISLCLSSNKESIYYLKTLGAKNVKYIGNIKFSQSDQKTKPLNKNLRYILSSKNIWCASSTHYDEEKICGQVHKKLKEKYKNLLTIIIPRHINRVDGIVKELNNLKLKVHLDNSKSEIKKDTDIYLVNSYGKTKAFFSICKNVFLGGSLINHGGQNPLEAARLGCNILHGNNVKNFREIYDFLNQNKISHLVKTKQKLEKKLDSLLSKRKISSNKIKNEINYIGGKILKKTQIEIKNFIDNAN